MSIMLILGGFTSVLCIVVSLIFLHFQKAFAYWKQSGNIKFIEPSFPFGNIKDTLLGRKHIGDMLKELYSKCDDQYVGIFALTAPALLVKDLDLIKTIFIKDFEHFSDRGLHVDEKNDPLSGHLLAAKVDKWKILKLKLSPAFTSGKLRMMFPTIMEIARNMDNEKERLINKEVDVFDLCSRYTIDVIGSVAFGVEVNSIENPEALFRKMCVQAISPNLRNFTAFVLTLMAPAAMQLFKFKSVTEDTENFMIKLVQETIEYREKSNVVRQDIMQLLIQLRNGGQIQEDGQWKANMVDESQKQMSVPEVTAQLYVFLLAGFDTSASTMAFFLYELAKNPHIQEKVYESIKEVQDKYDNIITYEGIHELQYLEQCLEETLRMYPISPFLARKCTKDFVLPDTNITLRKGANVWVSLLGLHYDEKYFPKPNEFNPDRFAPEERGNSAAAYMPFGVGPRICIGMRLAKLVTKIGMISLISKFKFELASGMESTLKMDPKGAPLLSPVGGIHIKFVERE